MGKLASLSLQDTTLRVWIVTLESKSCRQCDRTPDDSPWHGAWRAYDLARNV